MKLLHRAMAFLYLCKTAGQADVLSWPTSRVSDAHCIITDRPDANRVDRGKEGDSIYADLIKEPGYGVHHFGILVEDMNDAMAQAHSAGLNMIQDGSGFGLNGDGHYAYLGTEESLGVTLELIQRPEARKSNYDYGIHEITERL